MAFGGKPFVAESGAGASRDSLGVVRSSSGFVLELVSDLEEAREYSATWTNGLRRVEDVAGALLGRIELV